MILSMTGFGRGIAASADRKITVEIKSLNSKQLDLFMRVPSSFRELEIEARSEIAPLLERGKVELTAGVENTGPTASATLNLPAIEAYRAQIEQMADRLGIERPADWYATLLRLPDTLQTKVEEMRDDDRRAFLDAVKAAAEALTDFRITEGRKLHAFFCEKIANIGELLKEVEPFEKERVGKIRQRLEEQLESLRGIDYDKGRLEQELIFYIEKLDVSEEKLRLRSHLDYFLDTLGAADSPRPAAGQGKKLGFIAQEMGREINTLGSKSNNADMQKIVVRMKDELEQIKEQVLNVL
ncbi:MAG: YicC family protein [Muribaculaceae bacterium]|nr:YicC family protein [Bacteroides sp.]MDE6806084.1 YicC family protein [Muribaculaceae bacterium]